MPFYLHEVPQEPYVRIKLSNLSDEQHGFFLGKTPYLKYYKESDDSYLIHHESLRYFMSLFEDTTCVTQTIASILHEEVPYKHDFPMTNEGFDTLKIQPFPFQKVGINFLSSRDYGLLADSMGLGKSLQAIGAVHRFHLRGEAEKVLVVCPASIKYQWGEEVEKFTDYEARVIDGTTAKRKKQYAEFLQSQALFCIANYELIRSDSKIIKDMGFDIIICDEAHRIKNRTSKTYKALVEIPSKRRYALTGTPLQNNPEEIFALFDWLQKGYLGLVTHFTPRYIVKGTKFGRKFQTLGAKRLDELRQKIAPMMLRRTKEEVLPDLPQVIQNTISVVFPTAHRSLYNDIQGDFEEFNKKMYGVEGDAANKVMGYLYLMVAFSDHPSLLMRGQSQLAKKYKPFITPEMTSPKLKELLELSDEALGDPSSKLVIFTQYATMLDILVATLNVRFDTSCAVVKGSMSALERQEEIKRFRQDPNCRFIVLTDAGNYGINLTEGNIIVNYDLPWNPAVREQRIGRIHRIGSTHEQVQVIDMMTKDTFDETVWKVIDRKTQVNSAIIENTESEASHLSELLKEFLL